MTRVLVGPFAALLRAGVDDLLGDPRIHVVHATDSDDFLGKLITTRPDVVLLDLDADGTPERADRLSRQFPALTVVACSSIHPTMRVYPRHHHGESYLSPVLAGTFRRALRG
jgi:DNA-binding NarL/FixJ family response regulator